jgi:hypothetical protein
MTAPVLDKADYDVLNVVALKKMVTAEVIAGDTGMAAPDVGSALERLAGQGLVVDAAGAVFPADEAEPALAAAAAHHYASVREDPELASLVDRFETVNAQFLTTMSSWQQIEVGGRKVTNDHSDAEYDDKVIARLDKLVQRLGPLLDGLAEQDARFAAYSRRFTASMETIDAGQHDFVSSPTKDSVHNIWFEFHEDLLRTLGRERTE